MLGILNAHYDFELRHCGTSLLLPLIPLTWLVFHIISLSSSALIMLSSTFFTVSSLDWVSVLVFLGLDSCTGGVSWLSHLVKSTWSKHEDVPCTLSLYARRLLCDFGEFLFPSPVGVLVVPVRGGVDKDNGLGC